MQKIQEHTWLLKDQQVLISTFLARFLHRQIVRTALKPNMQFPAKTRYVNIPGMSTEPYFRKLQEAQQPQRNSTSAAHIGWLTDRVMHRTPRNRRGCIIFWHSKFQTLWFKKCWPKRILTWNSHSRSFILQSVTGRQGTAYRHLIHDLLFRPISTIESTVS